MTARRYSSRRRVLEGIASAMVVGSLAGCSGQQKPASETETETETESGSETSSEDADLDLREANVVDATVESADGSVTFDVTIHHDDAGEDGYANWWQVERLDGTRLGRRDLAHPHSEQPFTRSATIEVPAAVSCVVVRGHDETHGYGGQLLLVDLDSGATKRVRQGGEPRTVEESDCP